MRKTMSQERFDLILEVIRVEAPTGPGMRLAWDELMGDDTTDAQMLKAIDLMADRMLGAGRWHFEGGGEIAVSWTGEDLRILNYCDDSCGCVPTLLEGDKAKALLAWYNGQLREEHEADPQPLHVV